ncbi:hypothetical protein B0H14DRAFT_2749916 [Mycena olivaceomarginata]|nr:hypothetical protein B0H14DRAFT_2749916 [Mycena olivaceomarginata]
MRLYFLLLFSSFLCVLFYSLLHSFAYLLSPTYILRPRFCIILHFILLLSAFHLRPVSHLFILLLYVSTLGWRLTFCTCLRALSYSSYILDIARLSIP